MLLWPPSTPGPQVSTSVLNPPVIHCPQLTGIAHNESNTSASLLPQGAKGARSERVSMGSLLRIHAGDGGNDPSIHVEPPDAVLYNGRDQQKTQQQEPCSEVKRVGILDARRKIGTDVEPPVGPRIRTVVIRPFEPAGSSIERSRLSRVAPLTVASRAPRPPVPRGRSRLAHSSSR